MKRFLFILICLGCGLAQAKPIQVVTEAFPPFQFENASGEVVGLNTQIVQLVLEHADLQAQISIMPWARAYQTTLDHPNTLLYALAFTPERAHLFHYIGKLHQLNLSLYKLRERTDIQLTNLEQAKRYRIGVVNQDLRMLYLQKRGFRQGYHFQVATDDYLNLKKLFAGRIELIPLDLMGVRYRSRVLGLDETKVEIALPLPELSAELYMAMSRKSDAALVNQLRDSFQHLNQSGLIDQLKNRYFAFK